MRRCKSARHKTLTTQPSPHAACTHTACTHTTGTHITGTHMTGTHMTGKHTAGTHTAWTHTTAVIHAYPGVSRRFSTLEPRPEGFWPRTGRRTKRSGEPQGPLIRMEAGPRRYLMTWDALQSLDWTPHPATPGLNQINVTTRQHLGRLDYSCVPISAVNLSGCPALEHLDCSVGERDRPARLSRTGVPGLSST